MPKLTTDWMKVAQSGPTVDGRNIDPAWLLQAAETYSVDTYTAMLWPDHFRFQNYGKVLELRADTRPDSVVELFARIEPNAAYLWNNQFGQRLYFSMEIDPNFAATGKAYLVGLGVTDSPASLGTDELKFSHRRNKPESRFLPGAEFHGLTDDEEERVDGLIARVLQRFTIHPKTPASEEPMKNEQYAAQFEALEQRVAAFEAQVADLKASFAATVATSAQSPEQAKDQAKEQAKEKLAQGAPDTPDAFAKLCDTVCKLSQKLDAIDNRLAAAKPGETFNSTAPAGTAPLL